MKSSNTTSEHRLQPAGFHRFGTMICWGIPAIYGGGDNWYEPSYSKALEGNAANFKPTGFDPEQWAATAKAAGMSYIRQMPDSFRFEHCELANAIARAIAPHLPGTIMQPGRNE